MGQRWATPRQACPQPNGFGRNLRSKTRWFTGFCNSHQVSHFATFFIDAGAEISVAESLSDTRVASPPARAPSPSRRGRTKRFRFPWRVRRRVFVIQPGGDRPHKVRRLPTRGGPRSRTPLAIPHTSNKFAGRTACEASTMILPQVKGFDNDPSAGSPTETLLRLLLPLNDKVQWTSHNVAGSEPPTSPQSEHFTGPFNR
ncbi:hypothetical protein RIF29_01778 [Crotalaria pallida]|uniref:Uncharacterized protein n=1 Tax=Crotalaria pallida TaxID=3830 RepID=A0AAN9P7J2_CROPI